MNAQTNQEIPRIVHYIWVGEHPMPDRNIKLIKSNEQFLKKYDVRIWTEKNIDLSAPFVQRAYAEQRWAFVSDYVRFKLLYEWGGVYLDTDMELLKEIDDLLNVSAFSGFNRHGNRIYCGIVGAAPKHPLFVDILRDYDRLPSGRWPTSPEMFTKACVMPRTDIVIHPFSHFYPVDEGRRPNAVLLSQAYATHHWDESWRSFVALRRILRRLGIIPFYHWLTGKNS